MEGNVLVVMSRTGHSFLTGGHPFAVTTPLLCKFLLDAGFKLQLCNTLDRLNDASLAAFDAVVFHGVHQTDGGLHPALSALVHFVRTSGKGLVVVHVASASFARRNVTPHAEWLKLIGSAWYYADEINPQASHHPIPPRSVETNIERTGHPITDGLPPEFRFEREELYQNMLSAPEGETGLLLATGTDERIKNGELQVTTEPVAFALEHGSGRVFNCYPGHFRSTYRDPNFQRMVTQGVAWAAHDT